MLRTYPVLDPEVIKRQGQLWWACDEENCTAEAQVVDNAIPEGWTTSDPDNDPSAGAAQFCPEHEALAPLPMDLPAKAYEDPDRWREDPDAVLREQEDEDRAAKRGGPVPGAGKGTSEFDAE